MITQEQKDFWTNFLKQNKLSKETPLHSVTTFGDTQELVEKLTPLVLSGKKRASSSSVLAYELEGEPLLKAGDYWMITDYFGKPIAVAQTTQTMILPFKELTFDIIKREGEDECLETWQQGHTELFTREGKSVGYEFTQELLVLFEDFKIF